MAAASHVTSSVEGNSSTCGEMGEVGVKVRGGEGGGVLGGLKSGKSVGSSQAAWPVPLFLLSCAVFAAPLVGGPYEVGDELGDGSASCCAVSAEPVPNCSQASRNCAPILNDGLDD